MEPSPFRPVSFPVPSNQPSRRARRRSARAPGWPTPLLWVSGGEAGHRARSSVGPPRPPAHLGPELQPLAFSHTPRGLLDASLKNNTILFSRGNLRVIKNSSLAAPENACTCTSVSQQSPKLHHGETPSLRPHFPSEPPPSCSPSTPPPTVGMRSV